MNIARLLLGFSELSKAEVKQFTTGMNLYLMSSAVTRRQMVKVWEEELHAIEKKRVS